MKVDNLKLKVECDFSNEDCVRLKVGGFSCNKMFFGQCEDDGFLRIDIFCKEAFNNAGFFEDLNSKRGGDWCEGGILDVLDVHVYKGGLI
jgi:hypothetical protein